MLTMLARLRERPLAVKAPIMLVYGVLSFAFIFAAGRLILQNQVLFWIFELLWLIQVVFVALRIQRNQTELVVLALCALAPGLINNLLDVWSL